MASSAVKYVKDDATDDARDNVKMRAEAYRRCVRSIRLHPVLSAEWLGLCDSLDQLARWAQLEVLKPADSKVTDLQGRNDSGGTLWDQEQQENTIRILVEEAKVNLCVRMMNDYKQWQYSQYSSGVDMVAAIREASKTLSLSESQIELKTTLFEESLGMLLARSFMHVETLQLTDIQLLIEHCVMVFEACKGDRADAASRNLKSQETLVLYYFSSLMKHAEALNKPELLGKTRDSGFIRLAVDHVLSRAASYPPEVLTVVCEGFVGLSDNEDFKTDWATFFTAPDGSPDKESKSAFLTLEEILVEPLIKDTPDKKKDVRPLLDFFRTIQRTMK